METHGALQPLIHWKKKHRAHTQMKLVCGIGKKPALRKKPKPLVSRAVFF